MNNKLKQQKNRNTRVIIANNKPTTTTSSSSNSHQGLFYGQNDLSDVESLSGRGTSSAGYSKREPLEYYDDVKKNLNFESDDDLDDTNDDDEEEDDEIINAKTTKTSVLVERMVVPPIGGKSTTKQQLTKSLNSSKCASAVSCSTPSEHNLSTSNSMISLSTVTSGTTSSVITRTVRLNKPNTSSAVATAASRKKWK